MKIEEIIERLQKTFPELKFHNVGEDGYLEIGSINVSFFSPIKSIHRLSAVMNGERCSFYYGGNFVYILKDFQEKDFPLLEEYVRKMNPYEVIADDMRLQNVIESFSVKINKLREEMFAEAKKVQPLDLTVEQAKSLLNFPQVEKLFYGNNILQVVTEPLRFYVNGKAYPLGVMSIFISSTEVWFFNETKRVTTPFWQNSHHPHIYGDGYACFGNYEHIVNQLLLKKDYVTLISTILTFLESVNPVDSAGEHYHYWEEDEEYEEENSNEEEVGVS